MFKKIITHFFSLPCPACKKEMASSYSEFCPTCTGKLNIINSPFCPGCGGELDGILDICSKCLKEESSPWTSATALTQLRGYARELIQRYKYKNDTALSRPFASLAVNALKNSNIHFNIITSVPLHWTRKFTRGYNQSALVAKQVSKVIEVKYMHTLCRNKYSRSQTKLTGKERRKNLNNVFTAKNMNFIRDKDILLIDDVFTTGSTLRAATEELLKAKAKSVSILVLARR